MTVTPIRYGVVATVIVGSLAVAGCGGVKAIQTGTPAASSVAPAAVTTPTTLPLSFYAAQYTRINEPSLDAQKAVKTLPDSATLSDFQASARNIVTTSQAANAALLQADWPAKVFADIRAFVVADGPVLGDLNAFVTGSARDLAAANAAGERDSAALKAATNIVHADLGLPPIS